MCTGVKPDSSSHFIIEFLFCVYQWENPNKKSPGLTSVASATPSGQTASPAAPEATTGLWELLTGLPALASQRQRSAALSDGSAVIPTSPSTCHQTQHTVDMMQTYSCTASQCVCDGRRMIFF